MQRSDTLDYKKVWHMVSAPLRAMPHFLIIGAAKAGTTSLDRYLRAHPQVYRRKGEIHYFDEHSERSTLWYRSNFGFAFSSKLSCDKIPNYLLLPGAAQRLAQLSPNAKLIILVRNPIDRAYSHYQHHQRSKTPNYVSFEEVIKPELQKPTIVPKSLPVSYEIIRYRSYLARGYYAVQIQMWLDYFQKEQMFIIKSEIFFKNPAEVTAEVCHFLGIYDQILQQIEYRPRNVGGYQSEIASDIYQQLQEHFAPHNQKLCELTGISW